VRLVDVSCHWWKDAERSENYSVAHRGNCVSKQKALARLSQVPLASVTGGMSSSVCHHHNPPAPSGRASWHRPSSVLATTSLVWRTRPQAAPPSMIFHREHHSLRADRTCMTHLGAVVPADGLQILQSLSHLLVAAIGSL
jgi:hypothetical protein